MPRPARASLAMLALMPALALGAAGCGGGDGEIPDDAVAVVRGEAITKDEFDHWFAYVLEERTDEQPPLDPPRFTRCVAEVEKSVAAQERELPAKERAAYTAPDPLETCRDDYRGEVEKAMPSLIRFEWIEQMADELDVDVGDEEAIDLVFEEREEYERHLKETDVSREDTRFRIRIEALEKKLQEKAVETDAAVSDEDVKAHYDENEELYYGQPLEGLEETIRGKLFAEQFSREYKAATSCRRGYVINLCSNGPKLEAAPAPSGL